MRPSLNSPVVPSIDPQRQARVDAARDGWIRALIDKSRRKTESIYRRYAIVSEADLTEGVRKVAAMQAAGTSPMRHVVRLSDAEAPRMSTVRAQFAVGGRDADDATNA